jgi:perosamine synthetase
VNLGYNYRITDIQCALGMSQLSKLSRLLDRRIKIAYRYDSAFAEQKGVKPLVVKPGVQHAYHLYVVEICDGAKTDRKMVFQELRSRGIGVNVHYIPVHLHPYYRKNFRTGVGLCPIAEQAYEQIISLPMYPGMSDDDVELVIEAVKQTIGTCTKDRFRTDPLLCDQ